MPRPTAPQLALTLPASAAGLADARHRVHQFLVAHEVDEHALTGFELVLEEAVTNVIRHGWTDDDPRHALELQVAVHDEEIELAVVDDGRAFDPTEEGFVVLPETLDEAQVGGLGLLMIRNTASRMGYERRDGRNHFTLAIARA